MTKPTTPKPKLAKPHPDDPKGFVAVETRLCLGTSCQQCAIDNTAMCKAAPCFRCDRPDRKIIHYIKREPRRA